MPNPNFHEMRLRAKYGESSTEIQKTQIYEAVSEDSDQVDHKYLENVPWAGMYVELAHYTDVKQVVAQNISLFNGIVHYIDNTTGALVPIFVLAGEAVSFCDPDVTAGIMLYSNADIEITKWHLAFMGARE